MQITIVFPFRNRDTLRVKKALNSLAQQSKKNFKVLFIDYGSIKEIANEIERIVSQYSFVQYHYLFTENQPWNKSKAINYALKIIETEYCFIADVDMIFHNNFIEKSLKICCPDKSIYFQVGYLSEAETKKEEIFENYTVNKLSTKEATGMTLFFVANLKAVRGYDEFFHFWGSEDTDIHNRLEMAGFKTEYLDDELLLLHQWHYSYHRIEKKELTVDLQLSNIVQMNHQHLSNNKKKQMQIVNQNGWGISPSKSDSDAMLIYNSSNLLLNRKEVIEDFLFSELPNSKGQILSVHFVEDQFQYSLKYKFKKILGKKVPSYYTLKEINDKVLLHLISFYRDSAYSYLVKEDLKSICLKIIK